MQTANPMMPKNARQFFIDGPVGKIDCLELSPTNKIIGVAIIIHPDPKGGGTYTNKIVQTIAKVLNQNGYICYCPNLRGVGMSEGMHDMGVGEVDDAAKVYDYIRKNHPDLPLILAGFSFGASVASQLSGLVAHSKLILIGPAVTRYKVIVHDVRNTIVIHGELDEVISLDDVLNWGRDLNQPIIWFPGSGHFFHGKLIGLANLLQQIV